MASPTQAVRRKPEEDPEVSSLDKEIDDTFDMIPSEASTISQVCVAGIPSQQTNYSGARDAQALTSARAVSSIMSRMGSSSGTGGY